VLPASNARCFREMIMVWKWNPLPPPSPSQTFVDVGAPLASDPNGPLYLFWVGVDGTLWRLQASGTGSWQQVPVPPSAGPVTRIAVAPDNTAWCVARDPAQAFFLSKGDLSNSWKTPVGFPLEYQPLDVCVARDSSIWMVTTNRQQWVSTDGRTSFSFGLPLTALAGFTKPVSDANSGGAWGIIGNPSRPEIGGSIAFCNVTWKQTPPGGGRYISNVVDISTSPNYLWMVKTDGTVWTTQDGISEVRIGDTFVAQRITGGYVSEKETGTHLGETVYAVGKDGLPYMWNDG
jgi:hypothetical protein